MLFGISLVVYKQSCLLYCPLVPMDINTSHNQPYHSATVYHSTLDNSTDAMVHNGWQPLEDLTSQLCPTTMQHVSFHSGLTAPNNHLQHFDIYHYSPVPYSATAATTSSVSPQPSVDLDFSSMLIPSHYNSPSPTQTSLEQVQHHHANTLQFAGNRNVDNSIAEVTTSQQQHLTANKRSKSEQSRYANKSLKAVKKKRIIRSSPVFPSCSTPISLIGQCKQTPRSRSPLAKVSLINETEATDHLPMFVSGNDIQTNKSLSIVIQHSQTMQQLREIETKILKLQADRGRIMKSAEERSHLGGARICPQRKLDNSSLGLYLSSIEQYRHIENGAIEEGNCLTFKIGKLYSSLDCAIEKCISLCCSGHSSINTISGCFPYINSLINSQKHSKVRVLKHSNKSGFIHLEPQCNHPSSEDGVQLVIDTLNQILYHSQMIQQESNEISLSLQSLKIRMQEMLNGVDDTLRSSSIEKKLCIQAVIEGNLSIVCAIQQIWERTEKFGIDTLVAITDSLESGCWSGQV